MGISEVRSVGKLYIFATTFKDSMFRVGAHHLFDAASVANMEVKYFSSPNSVFNFWKIFDINQRRRIFWCLRCLGRASFDTSIPLNIAPYSVLRKYFSKSIALMLSAFSFKRPNFQGSTSIIDSTSYLRYVPYIINNNGSVIYRPTDIYFHSSQYELELEIDYVKTLRVPVWCMSKPSYDFYRSQGFNVIGWCPNGIPSELAENYRGYVKMPKSNKFRCVYVGAIDDRLSIEKLLRIHDSDNFELEIYGLGPLLSKLLKSRLRETYRGPLSYDKMNAYLNEFHIGLLPFNEDKKNLSRSPMKKLEYQSAGLYVANNELIEKLLRSSGADEISYQLKQANMCEDEVGKELSLNSWNKILFRILDSVEASV